MFIMCRWHVISSILWRNLKQYFSGMLGYVIIVVFVTVCAVMTFSQQFFADNLANLDQLTAWFPLLLLFLAPAITMTSWAEERKQGTDAILFTLPASDFEITLGKYLAASAVYSIALLFSLSQLVSIAMLGAPDWGVVASTYLGYWLAGLALLSIGMFASSLTESPTVAFVLGAAFCAVPVLVGVSFRGVSWVEWMGVDWQLNEFAAGLLKLSGVVYFLGIVCLMLYLNLVIIGQRHWNRGRQVSLGGHFVVRVAALVIALVSLNYFCAFLPAAVWNQADLTAERLYTLDSATSKTLNQIREIGQPVTIETWVSRDVPREYVSVKKNLLNLVRRYESIGGKDLTVEIHQVEPNSDMGYTAIGNGIQPETVRSETNGKVVEQEVMVGCVIKTATGDVTIPRIDSDTFLEYELTRGIASAVDQKNRLKLGIVATDTHFGGPEFDGRRVQQWAYNQTLRELEKMYTVQHIPQNELPLYVASVPEPAAAPEGDAASAKPPEREAPDVLLVPDPSSLDESANAALISYLADGHPVLLLVDPLPMFWTTQNPQAIGVLNAPLMPRVNMQSPYAQVLTSSFLPKAEGGTASSLMAALGLQWNSAEVAWSLTNPHPNFSGFWPATGGQGWPTGLGRFDCAFNYVRLDANRTMIYDHPVSKGLNELLFFYPGSVRDVSKEDDLDVQPMISLGKSSGAIPWSEVTTVSIRQQRQANPRTGRMEVVEQPERSQITGEDLVLIRDDPSAATDEVSRMIAAQIQGKGNRKENAIVICDLDFVSDLFQMQETALKRQLDQQLDNLRLLQNSIEVLAGDPGFVSLRNRRPRTRTLETVEKQVESFRKLRTAEQKKKEDLASAEVDIIQAELEKVAAEINEDTSMNFIQKIQMASQSSMDAEARYQRRRQILERDLKRDIDQLKATEQSQITRLENRYRAIATLLAPLPALLLGLVVFAVRTVNENSEVRTRRTKTS